MGQLRAKISRNLIRYLLVLTWITFTATLAGWWLIFGLRQSERLLKLQSEPALELARHQRMLVSEGAILILLVVVGGISLLYYMALERRHFERVREFFATYTHDLKTSLASLRLQAESLQEDQQGQVHPAILARLVKDTVRLELQLENSLYIANPHANLFLEKIDLRKAVANFRDHWPEVNIEIQSNCELLADSRALESIFKNLLQNAVSHGSASRIVISATAASDNLVRISVQDNGVGFRGEQRKLGQLFVRHSSHSGSGVGLYLVTSLLRQMNGQFHASPVEKGFLVELLLPGRAL